MYATVGVTHTDSTRKCINLKRLKPVILFNGIVMVYDYLLVIRTKSLFPYILIFSPLFLAHDTSAHKVTELVSF